MALKIALGAAAVALATASPLAAQNRDPAHRLSEVQAVAELQWPLPKSLEIYDSIDGERMKGFVEELAAISRRSRDAGDRWWGRMAARPSGRETERWVAEKFRAAGLDVRLEEFELSPQHLPLSFELTVEGEGAPLTLTSASPIIAFADYMPAATGDESLDAEWVGLGMASDFVGRDLKGKAVFIYSVPTPSSLIQSEGWIGAASRAQAAGAAAIVIVLAIPGNLSFVSHIQGLSREPKLPVFTLGLDDGEAVEKLNAAAKEQGRSLKARLRWQFETRTGLTAHNVVGLLPGRTDENIVVVSHADGFFEGANDNAAGIATLIGLAEHYAKRPRAERRRTLYFIATADHHSGDRGGEWVHEHMRSELEKTALILNTEHVSVMEPVWDRPWGSRVRPELLDTNQLGASWWGVYGSDRLAIIVRDAFAAFGVPTQIDPGGSAGQLRPVQWDAPSFYLHNKGVFYHADLDTPKIVPATGLRTATQAFARIFDQVNELELPALRR